MEILNKANSRIEELDKKLSELEKKRERLQTMATAIQEQEWSSEVGTDQEEYQILIEMIEELDDSIIHWTERFRFLSSVLEVYNG